MNARNYFLLHCLMFFCIIRCSANELKADLLIFSFDRPLQLYALLESVEKYVEGLSEVAVLYRTSNSEYDKAYNIIKSCFPNVIYVQQAQANPHGDFKEKTIRILNNFPNDYILFAVDDIIVKDRVDIAHCIQLIENTSAYGFYLRLGENINYCYTLNKPQRAPLTRVSDDVRSWKFIKGIHEWAYPNTVDMTIYRKKDVLRSVSSFSFKTPNSFEAEWAGRANLYAIGLCFATSKIVNIPLNSVSEYKNRNMNFATSKELLNLFNSGYKIDIYQFHRIDNNAPHMEYIPNLIPIS